MVMKKLTIKFNDGSQVKYEMKNDVDHMVYFRRHSIVNMESAILQQYPKKNNEPIDLLKNRNRNCLYCRVGGTCLECTSKERCDGYAN